MKTEKQKEEERELYAKFKARGICPKCGKEEAAYGRVHCPNCLDEMAVCQMIRRANLTEEQKKQEKAKALKWAKVRYRRLREQGICVRCGKRKAQVGKAKCFRCQEKENEQKRIRWAERKEKKKWEEKK